jgi:hypothetical protein
MEAMATDSDSAICAASAVAGRSRARALRRGFAGALVALLLLAGGSVAQAAPASPIEAVWSFNGGEVAIQPQAGGSFVGTVVETTKFAQCSHAVGEQMWSSIRLQSDGSYWGFHQWYFETNPCQPNPVRGPTAWRVLKTSGGARTLIVCFSSPGSSQPLITTTDARLDVTYGCFESALIAPLPAEAKALAFKRSVSLPSARKCFSARAFPIHFRDPLHDPLKSVVVRLGTHKLTVLRHGRTFTATINLKGLPRGTFKVHIFATTVLGQRLSGSRTYHTCRSKRLNRASPGPLRKQPPRRHH